MRDSAMERECLGEDKGRRSREGVILRRPINGLPGSGPTIAGRVLVTVSRNKME